VNDISRDNRQLLISFSGIDGAGKSTQISRLTQHFRREGLRVDLITFWDEVVVLKRFREAAGHKVFKGDTGVGSPEEPIRRRDKDVQSPLLTFLRTVFYALDALSLRRAVNQARTAGSCVRPDVIIFDRFIYDELANLNARNILLRSFVSAILRLAPKPGLAFLLDANPDAAFARKPEYPLEFLHANRRAYLHLAEVAHMTVIAADSIDKAHAEILRHLDQKNALPSQMEMAGALVDREQFIS
jgi:thymidylate kinase